VSPLGSFGYGFVPIISCTFSQSGASILAPIAIGSPLSGLSQSSA